MTTILFKNVQHKHVATINVQQHTFSYVTLPKDESTGDWQYVKTMATLETPYDTFEEVHVFEHTFDEKVERYFIAKQFGIVQYEIEQNNRIKAINYSR